MIAGVGIDIVEIDRIAAGIKRHGKAFIARIAHSNEKRGAPASGNRQAEYWAGRFAVKEAFAKALGTGIGKACQFTAVGVKKTRDGRPSLTFSPGLKKELTRRGISRSHVSISHDRNSAIAVVILE